MKSLIVEEDFASRLLLQEHLKCYGASRLAVNSVKAVEAVREALEAGEPYDLICLDIMLPEMDGQAALRQIRGLELARSISPSHWVKIMMTTPVADLPHVSAAYLHLCDACLTKPIRKAELREALRKLALIN